MSLVWHMIRKDLRRLQLPLSLWLALVLAHTGLLLLAGGKPEDPVNPAAFEAFRYFANTWGVIVSAVGFVLSAWLVMEDSLVVTSAFWPTRPISNARLLLAKVLGATLMFSVGPVLVLTPIWLGSGFSARELMLAAWHCAAMQGLLSAAAFAIAGVTATSGQFLVRAAGAAILVPVGVAFGLGEIWPAEGGQASGLVISRDMLVYVLLAVTPLVVIVHQYLTRRTLRSGVLAALGFGLILGVRFLWFWDISAWVRSNPGSGGTEAPEVHSVRLINESPVMAFVQNRPEREQFSFQGVMTGVPAGCYVRVNASFAEWTKESERVPLFRRMRAPGALGRPPEFLARQIAGLAAAIPEATPWSVAGEELTERVNLVQAGGWTLAVTLDLSLMRGRVLGEMPLRIGAELHSGSSRTRISAIERTEAGLVVRLDDRAAQPDPTFESFGGGPQAGPLQARLAEDAYIVIHRPTAFAQVPALHEIGGVQINSILVGQRELVITPPTREINGQTAEIPGWADDAVIIQVRFRPELTFTRLVAGNPFTAAPGR